MLSTEKLTGFADEASRDIDKQIQATKELGWSAISTRMVGNANIHDMPEGGFGWLIIRQLAHDVRYARHEGVNQLSFRIAVGKALGAGA